MISYRLNSVGDLVPFSPLLQHGSGLRPEETTANTESLLEGSCFLRPDPVSEGNINLTVKKCESVSYCSRTQLYLNIPETEIIFGIQNSAIKVEKYSHTLYPAAYFFASLLEGVDMETVETGEMPS